MNQKTLTITAMAFLVPLCLLIALRFEDFEKLVEVDPNTAPGRVIYFTAPS